jgi:predicted RNase H-like HicB family nuclease
MKLKSVVELWDDGTYSIYVTNLKRHNLNAQGSSVEEAKNNLQNAICDYVDMYKQTGKAIPRELQNPVFVYKYDMASFFDCFKWINVSNFAQKAEINPSLLLQYKNKITFASEKQKEKIQKTINQMGKELAAVRL